MEFTWDDHNREHATRHGVSLREITDMVDHAHWVRVRDTRGRWRRRRVIGPTSHGRFVTLVVEATTVPAQYRPVTSWPSTAEEIRL